jgi:hypothetical protein
VHLVVTQLLAAARASVLAVLSGHAWAALGARLKVLKGASTRQQCGGNYCHLVFFGRATPTYACRNKEAFMRSPLVLCWPPGTLPPLRVTMLN